MKRKWIMVAGLCVFITTTAIGCGTKGEDQQAVTVESADVSNNGQGQENELSQDDITENNQSENSGQAGNDDQQQGTKAAENKIEELEGNVKSIGDSSAVIIKAIIEERGDVSLIMVGSAPGYESEEDLVNVSFKETTEYELRVVKNGGVNPDEDVSIREAAFSDIKEQTSISLEGYYEGDTFIAEKVILYEFV